MGIVAQIDDPVLAALAILDEKLPMLEVQDTEREMSNLLDPQPAAKHQHEHGPVARSFDRLEEALHLLVLQVPGQRPGHLQGMVLPDRIDDVQNALFPQVVIELADAVQMTVDGLGLQPPSHQLVDVVRDLGVGHALDRHIEPQHKAADRAQVVLNRVGRAVAPLQIAPPVDDRIRHRRSPLSITDMALKYSSSRVLSVSRA